MSNKPLRRQLLMASTILWIATSTAFADSPLKLRVSGRNQIPIQSRMIQIPSDAGQPIIVTAIASDPMSETIAVAGDDNHIRIISGTSLKTIRTLRGHRDRIRTLAFDPSGNRLVSAGNDGQVIVWDCKDAYAIRQRMEGTPAMARVRFSPSGGEMAAVGFDNEVYIMGRRASANSSRDQASGSPIRRATMLCECRDLRAVSYSDDETLLAIAGRSGDLHLFDVESGRLVGEHPIHSGRIDDLAFARGSNLAISVGEDGRIVSFDTAAEKIVRRTKVTSGKLFAIAMLDSQLAAVAGSDNVIRIVNIDSGKVVRSLEGHLGSVPTLAATGGYLFSGSFDATLRRWAIADLKPSDERIAEKNNGEKRE
ncbi:WD domain, G-beta repeat [Rubripirellula obstinata]|uniref:WD domain, G-beta repeat n=1 Tax=Rubripirellula obstinata TaxID=406547 RepID=A0A5B1CN93_9BACT|nr:hypothetical protein [Rubripirellula obstinata]KAA1261832.1 WD domain, G-beta repeat [Rubripirellula obstinata]